MFEQDKLKELIKYIPAYLIFLGAIRLVFYYKAFNINVVEYLEFSEFLLSIFSFFIIIIFCVLIPGLFYIGLFGRSVGKYNNVDLDLKKKQTFPQRLIIFLKSLNLWTALLMLSFFLYLLFKKEPFYTHLIFIFYPIFTILNFLYTEIRISYYNRHQTDISPTYHNLGLIVTLIILLTLNDTYLNVYKVKHQYKFHKTTICLDDRVLISDSSNTYIGKTMNYIYFYNLKNETPTIFPISKVKSINLVEK